MEEYWFLYGEYFQGVMEKHDWYYNTNEQIKEIYDKYNDLFPNDDEDNLSKISLYLYLYYDKRFILNNLHLEILSLSKLQLSIQAIKYIIQKDQEHFEDVIGAINHKKVTVYQSKLTEKIKLWSEKSLKSVKTIGENFERKLQYFNTNDIFNGQFNIADASRVHTHRRGSIRDRFMGMEKSIIVKTKSRYNASEANIERIFEVWLNMIKEFYNPLEVCISTTYIFLFSQTGRTHEISKKKKSNVYSRSMKSKREKHSTFDPNLFLIIPKHLIDELEQCKQDKFLVRLFIRYDDRFTGHANALIIDKKNKFIYRMEPDGIDEENDRQIEEQLTNYPYFLWKKYIYMGTVKTCPKKLGTQNIEKDLRNVLKIPMDYSGSTSCFMWSLLFLEYIIHYKDIYQKPSDVYNHIIHHGNLIHLIYGYIADLMLRYEKMEMEGYRFKNTEKMHLSSLQIKNEIENLSQQVFEDFLFDVGNDDHVIFLYNVIYDGYTTFNEVFARIFSNELSEEYLIKQLDNIENLLEDLQDGTLIDKLLNVHEKMNPGREFPQKHLPSSNIEYYKPIVENFANEIHNEDIAFEMFEIIQSLFY